MRLIKDGLKSAKIILTGLVIFSFMKIYAQTDTIQTTVPALKNVFRNDFNIGCLLSYRNIGFPTDSVITGQSPVITHNGGYLIKYHMNSMSPGNNMKPQYTVDLSGSAAAYNAASTSAAKDSIDTHPLVRFNGDIIAQLNWAKKLGFTFRGHTLVWYNQTPGTGFFRAGYSSSGDRLTKEKMTARLENYIKEVIRLINERWPGLLSAFDVVNEAVNDNGTDRSTSNEWYTTFGDNSYIAKSFEFARKYTKLYNETQIKLYYNDYSTHLSAKADGIVRVCTPIWQAGNLDGIGMQEHDSNTSPTAGQWIASYNKFSPICTEMAVTEFDVSTGSTAPSSSLLTQQANQYAQLVKCFVERSYKSGRGKIISVSKDGLNDAYTMTNQASSLWDSKNQCKPAFYAVVDVGVFYNKLDSLTKYINTLKQSDYASASWANLSNTLIASKATMDQNFDYQTSVSTALNTAFSNLNNSVKSLVKSGTGISAENNILPNEFSLSQNYPNPFNPSTQIKYAVPQNSFVSLKVYNCLGQVVTSLFEGYSQPGTYTVTFDGRNLASGIYLYQLKAGNYIKTMKFVLIK